MPDINLANMAWWQARAEKAEAERDRLREALAALKRENRELRTYIGKDLSPTREHPQ